MTIARYWLADWLDEKAISRTRDLFRLVKDKGSLHAASEIAAAAAEAHAQRHDNGTLDTFMDYFARCYDDE